MVLETVVKVVDILKGKVLVYQICMYLDILERLTIAGNNREKEMDREQQVGDQWCKHKFRYDYRKIIALLNQTMKIKYKFVPRAM